MKVNSFYCSDNATLENCTELSTLTNQRTAKLHFQIFHNGTQGILSAKVYIWLRNTASSQRPDQFVICLSETFDHIVSYINFVLENQN